MLRPICRVAVLLSFCWGITLTADEPVSKARKRIVTNPKLVDDAAQVPLFTGMKNGSFDATVIAKDAYGGNLLVTNNTDQPLTVQLPDAFVAVNVLKQLGNQFGNNNIFPNGAGGNQFANGGSGGGNGQAQNIGGGVPGGVGNGNNFLFPGGNGNNGFFPGGNGNANGNAFFSIPPEATLKVKFVSACLNHGDPQPTIRTKYQIVPVETYTADTAYHEVLRLVGTGKLSRKAAQAAVWHYSDNMSWQQLASKSAIHLGRRVPYFSIQELKQAQKIVEYAKENAESASSVEDDTVAQASPRR